MKKLLLLITLLLLIAFPAYAVIFIGAPPPVDGACTWSTVWDAETVTGAGDNWQDYQYAGRNNRTFILSAATTGSGSQIRITIKGHSTLAGEITDAAIGPKKASADPYDYDSTATNITFNTGSDSGTIPANGTLVSDDITFTFSTGSDYIVALFSSDGDMGYLDDSTVRQYKRDSQPDQTEIVNVTSYSSHSYLEYLWKIEACD